jgi:hypothetical protein
MGCTPDPLAQGVKIARRITVSELTFWKEPYGLNTITPEPIACRKTVSTMNVFVGIALGWLVIGSLIAVVVLTEHFLAVGRFPGKAGWWTILAFTIGWPWPVWGWYVTDTETPRTARVGLATFMLIEALGLGWGGGLKLYDFLYPKELEPPDTPALNAMVEHIISDPSEEPTHIGIPPRLFTFR